MRLKSRKGSITMNDNKDKKKKEQELEEKKRNKYDIDGRYSNETGANDIPGINTPGLELPAYNPPVPNRAWTAMRNGMDIDSLTEQEKRELYYGKDSII